MRIGSEYPQRSFSLVFWLGFQEVDVPLVTQFKVPSCCLHNKQLFKFFPAPFQVLSGKRYKLWAQIHRNKQ